MACHQEVLKSGGKLFPLGIWVGLLHTETLSLIANSVLLTFSGFCLHLVPDVHVHFFLSFALLNGRIRNSIARRFFLLSTSSNNIMSCMVLKTLPRLLTTLAMGITKLVSGKILLWLDTLGFAEKNLNISQHEDNLEALIPYYCDGQCRASFYAWTFVWFILMLVLVWFLVVGSSPGLDTCVKQPLTVCYIYP